MLTDALEHHVFNSLSKTLQAKLIGQNIAGWQITFKDGQNPVLTIKYKE